MSQHHRSLDPVLVQAAVAAARERLPAGEPLTLDALEEAILAVFRELGPAVAEEVAAPTTGPHAQDVLWARCAWLNGEWHLAVKQARRKAA